MFKSIAIVACGLALILGGCGDTTQEVDESGPAGGDQDDLQPLLDQGIAHLAAP